MAHFGSLRSKCALFEHYSQPELTGDADFPCGKWQPKLGFQSQQKTRYSWCPKQWCIDKWLGSCWCLDLLKVLQQPSFCQKLNHNVDHPSPCMSWFRNSLLSWLPLMRVWNFLINKACRTKRKGLINKMIYAINLLRELLSIVKSNWLTSLLLAIPFWFITIVYPSASSECHVTKLTSSQTAFMNITMIPEYSGRLLLPDLIPKGHFKDVLEEGMQTTNLQHMLSWTKNLGGLISAP